MAKDPVADAKKFLESSKKAFEPLTPDKASTSTPQVKMPADAIPSVGQELAAKKQMVDKARQAIPTMHKGGLVKKDGLHNLQKGELVVAKDKVKEMKNAKGLMAGMSEASEEKSEPKDKKKEEKPEKKSDKKSDKKEGKHRHKSTVIEHHSNGSHTVRHIPHQSPEGQGKPAEEVSYAAPDMAALHAGMDQNLGGGAEPAPDAAAAAGPAGAPQA